MSKFVGIVIGAVEVGIGLTVPGAQGLIVPGLMMIAGSTATLLLTPTGDLTKRQALQTTLQLGEGPRGAVLGRIYVSPTPERGT